MNLQARVCISNFRRALYCLQVVDSGAFVVEDVYGVVWSANGKPNVPTVNGVMTVGQVLQQVMLQKPPGIPFQNPSALMAICKTLL